MNFTATSWAELNDGGKHPDIEVYSGPTSTDWDQFPSANDTGPAGSTLRAQGDFLTSRSFGGTFELNGTGARSWTWPSTPGASGPTEPAEARSGSPR